MTNAYRFNVWHALAAALAFGCAVCLVDGNTLALAGTFVSFVVVLALAEIIAAFETLPARVAELIHHRGAEDTEQEALASEISNLKSPIDVALTTPVSQISNLKSPIPSPPSAPSAPLWCKSLPERCIPASS